MSARKVDRIGQILARIRQRAVEVEHHQVDGFSHQPRLKLNSLGKSTRDPLSAGPPCCTVVAMLSVSAGRLTMMTIARILIVWTVIAAFAQIAYPTGAAAQKLNTAYISTTPGSSTVLQVAKDARIFEKHGVDATVIFLSGSVRGIQAILAGEIPIGEGGGPGLASALLAGGDVIAVAGNINVLPYYLVAQPSIKKPEDLRGKIGGNHIAGTTAEFALRVALKKMGMDPLKDVNLRVIGGSIDRMVALQKGIVNFTVVTETGKVMAEKLGFPTLVDMATLEIPFPQNGLYTSTRLIRERPDIVRRYVRAYVEAIHYYATRKEETLKILEKYSRVSDRKALDESWIYHA